jgi:SOS-response transcriptional repressor LexA
LLTDKQQQVLDFISYRIEYDRRPPTIREIKDHFGWSSDNAVKCHVDALVKKDRLKNAGGSRGLVPR